MLEKQKEWCQNKVEKGKKVAKKEQRSYRIWAWGRYNDCTVSVG